MHYVQYISLFGILHYLLNLASYTLPFSSRNMIGRHSGSGSHIDGDGNEHLASCHTPISSNNKNLTFTRQEEEVSLLNLVEILNDILCITLLLK